MTLSVMQYVLFCGLGVGILAIMSLVLFLTIKKRILLG